MGAAALKVRHLARYRDIARLLLRHARRDGEAPPPEGGAREDSLSLAAELEALGPTFVKLGQLLSTRADVLPPDAVNALSRLQDSVEPFPFEDARRIVEEDLGEPLSRSFRRFQRRPFAAASLSQIHRAVLRDGRTVAVKVQRPGIREVIQGDMEALAEAARFIDRHTRFGRRYELSRVIDELRETVFHELDFRQEAANLRRLSDALAAFDRLAVPAPVDEFSGPRVLSMEYLPGRKITGLPEASLRRQGGPELADQIFRAYLKQILVDGFFHADPHPGNLLLAKDGRAVLLDLGMVGRVGPELRKDLLVLLLAIADVRSDDAASVALRVGTPREGFDEQALRTRVGALVLENAEATISQVSFGRIVLDIARVSAECGLRLPSVMTLIGKALLNLDPIVTALDPDFEPAQAVRGESVRLLQDRLMRRASRAGLAAGALELEDFVEKLPGRVGRVLDVLGGDELRVKVDAVDEKLLIQGMQKIANRIAMGVVLASLIIAAALLLQSGSGALEAAALALFGAAGAAGLVLVADILYYDEKRRARLRSSETAPPRD